MRAHPRILLVEDDKALRFAMAGVLRRQAYEVLEAESFVEATSKLDAKLDVVIADLRLPDGEGLALLPLLREIDPTIVVLIVTGFGTIDLAVRALKNGAENFLTKPVDPAELIGQVQAAVGRRIEAARRGADSNRSSDVQLRAATPDEGALRAEEATLKDVEREHIRRALVAENGRVEAAARRLGVPRSTLYQKVKVYGLHVPRVRGQAKGDREP